MCSSVKFWRNFIKPWQLSFPDPNRRTSDFCYSVWLTDWWIDIHSIGHLFDWPFFTSILVKYTFWWNDFFCSIGYDEFTQDNFSCLVNMWDFYWDTSRICTNSLQSELDYVLDYLHAFLSTHPLHCCRGYFSVPCFLCASSCRVSCRVLSFLFVTASLAPPQISPDQAHKTKCGLICQKLSFDGYNYLLLILPQFRKPEKN